MDGQMEGKQNGKNGIYLLPYRLPLSLSLIGALINYASALNANAVERNIDEANSYHDFCSNQSAVVMFI